MSSGEEYQKEAEGLLYGDGKPSEIAHRFQLAAHEFAREGKTKEANESASMYRFFSGISYLQGAYTLNDLKEAIKHFRGAKRLLEGSSNSEAHAISEAAEGFAISAKGLSEAWQGNLDESLKIFEKVDQHFLQLKDLDPNLSDFAEMMRLEVLIEAYFVKATVAYDQGDSVAYTGFAGDSIRLTEVLISKTNGELRKFYEGIQFLRQASFKAMSTAMNRAQGAGKISKKPFKEACGLLTQSIERFTTTKDLYPRAEALRMHAAGMQQLINAILDSEDADWALFAGKPRPAKKKYENALDKANEAIRIFSEIAQWGKQYLPPTILLRDKCKRKAMSIALAARKAKRRIAIAASTQFGFVFFISLATFVILNYIDLLQIAPLQQVYFSLIVAGITAFGLNALKLKELIIPSHLSKSIEPESSS